MITLQRPYGAVAPSEGADPPGGRGGRGQGGDVGHLVLDGGLADVGIIVVAELAAGGVDDQLDLAVFDGVDDIRPALVKLEKDLGRNPLAG